MKSIYRIECREKLVEASDFERGDPITEDNYGCSVDGREAEHRLVKIRHLEIGIYAECDYQQAIISGSIYL